MKKSELPGVKQGTGKSQVLSTVDRVPAQRMVQCLEVNPDLVRSPRPQPAMQQAAHREPLRQGEGRPCRPATRRRGHFVPLYRVTADRRGALHRRFLEDAAADRQVPLGDFTPGELADQLEVNPVSFCDDQTTGGALIQAMDDPGPRVAADRTQRTRSRQQRVDQRARAKARTRMNGHARGLIQHEQVLVFEEDV